MKKTKIQDLLPQSQLLGVIDKGLKAYENMLGADVLESNPHYITFVGILTDCQLDNTVCENFDQIQRLWVKFVNSL